jgi:hypothetical protein
MIFFLKASAAAADFKNGSFFFVFHFFASVAVLARSTAIKLTCLAHILE